MQKPLKTRVNSKYQSKGSTYILHLLASVEIRLFNVFFWERKARFGKLMKNVRDAGFSRKTGGNAGSGPPLPDPLCKLGRNLPLATFGSERVKKAWVCCCKSLFLLSPSPLSSVDCVETKRECRTSTLYWGGGERENVSF